MTTYTQRSFLVIVLFLSFIGIGTGVFASVSGDNSTTFEDLTHAPPEVQTAYQDWPLANKDYANTRNQQETNISSNTVKNLQVSWTHPISGHTAFGSAATNPLIVHNAVFFQDLAGNIASLNLYNGSILWSKTYNSTTILGPNGPAIGSGTLYISPDGYSVSALNSSDGTERWSTRISPSNSTGINIQPVVYDGKVLLSTVPGTSANDFYGGGQFGELYAIDETTGMVLWNTSTIDTPSLWGNASVNSGGGAWYSPAIDTMSGITFWGIGNPAPYPGTPAYPAGSSRPGPNLYTDSIMAIDENTGAMVWYNQVKPHDLFDLDFQIPPVLATIQGNDSTISSRDVVFGAGKLGKVYAFDRHNGSVIWNTSVGVHNGNADLQDIPEGKTIQVLPGFLGGVETPMAYADGMLFVPVVNFPSNYSSTAFDTASLDLSTGTGELVALNATTGKEIWKIEYPSMVLGGATVVSDLVFTATNDGTIYAYKAKSGILSFTYKAPSGINGWPAVGMDSIIWPAGATNNPVLLALNLSPSPVSIPIVKTIVPLVSDGRPIIQESSNVITTPVSISNFAFSPPDVTVTVGSSVTWKNEDTAPHDIISGKDAAAEISSPMLNKGETFEFIFTKPGDYPYICGVHPSMTGIVHVTP